MQLPTAGLVWIKDRKLLLAYSNNKQCFYLPGGKINPGETARAALCREIAEELCLELQQDELRYYTHITAPAFGEADGTMMEQDCFITSSTQEPHPAGEIGRLHYFTLAGYLQQPVTAPGAVMILELLKREGKID